LKVLGYIRDGKDLLDWEKVRDKYTWAEQR
jgi:hypothetical protein